MKLSDIDITKTVTIAQLTFILMLIAVALLVIAFGKIDRQLKSPKH